MLEKSHSGPRQSWDRFEQALKHFEWDPRAEAAGLGRTVAEQHAHSPATDDKALHCTRNGLLSTVLDGLIEIQDSKVEVDDARG